MLDKETPSWQPSWFVKPANSKKICGGIKRKSIHVASVVIVQHLQDWNSKFVDSWFSTSRLILFSLVHATHVELREHVQAQANIYWWRSNFADSRLLCNRTYLGDVAEGILEFLPWWLKNWTLRRRHKLFTFHCPDKRKTDNAKQVGEVGQNH